MIAMVVEYFFIEYPLMSLYLSGAELMKFGKILPTLHAHEHFSDNGYVMPFFTVHRNSTHTAHGQEKF
jgi:hypothetical protein